MDQQQADAYRLMLRAIMLRQGGSLLIRPDEIADPEHGFTICWRYTDDGGLEAKLEDDGTRQ